jgi:F-type H+-transporting ATPase subunit epsilon
MATMHVELVSLEERLWSGEADAVFARTVEGEIGILPHHAPLLAALAPGWVVRIKTPDEPDLSVAVHGGFLAVRGDGVSVLAEMAELGTEIDVRRAREALQASEGKDDPESIDAHNRALARLRAAGETV